MVDAAVALRALEVAGLSGPFAVHAAANPGIIDRRMHQVFVGEDCVALRKALSGRIVESDQLESCIADAPYGVIVLPAWSEPHSGGLPAVAQIVDRLLGPGGCQWDQEQTHDSLKRHLIEECYELVEAIESCSDADFREELGDVLLQPVMHAQMSKRDGAWDIDVVALELVNKLIRRHPHVFGDLEVADSGEVLRNWDAIKQTEKSTEFRSILEGVPVSLPALLRAFEISKRAARVGFEWPSLGEVLEKLSEEDAELREALLLEDNIKVEAELGDMLFTLVNVARWSRIEPEEALRKMLARFSTRFQGMERQAERPLSELSSEDWDSLWNAEKSRET